MPASPFPAAPYTKAGKFRRWSECEQQRGRLDYRHGTRCADALDVWSRYRSAIKSPLEKEFYDVRLEKPTFCAVINCVSLSGLPSGFTTTRSRNENPPAIPQPDHINNANALSVTWPAGSSHRTSVWSCRSSPPFTSSGGSQLFSSELNWL